MSIFIKIPTLSENIIENNILLVVVDDFPLINPTDNNIFIVTWLIMVWVAELTDKRIEIKVIIDKNVNFKMFSSYSLHSEHKYY